MSRELLSLNWGAFRLHSLDCTACRPIERCIARGEITAEAAKHLGVECCQQGRALYEAWLYAVGVALEESKSGRRRIA